MAELQTRLSTAEIDAIVAEYLSGSERAFQRIYELYAASMQGVIFNIVQNEEVAQEVMQDVFIKAWQKRSQYSTDKGRIFTWLLNISRNAAIDRFRSAGYQKQKKNVSASNFAEVLESNDDLQKRIDGIGLKDYVKKLGEKCRSLIDLLYFKGYTQSEVADETDTPLGTVKTNSRRCISKLREAIAR